MIARLAMLALGLGLAWFGFQLAMGSWSVAMAGAPLGVGMRFVPVAIGGALIALFAVERLVRSWLDEKPLAKPADIGEDA
jgi:TRAP-type C4-dicarboxylate transport system permease small subunit